MGVHEVFEVISEHVLYIIQDVRKTYEVSESKVPGKMSRSKKYEVNKLGCYKTSNCVI